MTEITVQTLDESSLMQLVDLAERFVQETGWEWTFDIDVAFQTLEKRVDADNADILGAFDGQGMLIGAAMIAWDRDFCLEPIAYLEKLYIEEDARGLGAGRHLARAICDWAVARDCAAIFATATAGLGDDKQFQNLMHKYGFRECGPTLVREVGR